VREEGGPAGGWTRARRALPRGAPSSEEVPAPGAVGPAAISRVFRKRAAAPVEAVPAQTRSDWPARAAAPSARAAELSPTELSRLTDHIVHTIDRRIAAFRERQGRV
jgi:hypothetical protein